jgi:hypothetical protein
MYVHLYLYLCIYVYIYLHICVYIYLDIWISNYLSPPLYYTPRACCRLCREIQGYVHLYTLYVNSYSYVCVQIIIYIYICMYLYSYTYICIYLGRVLWFRSTESQGFIFIYMCTHVFIYMCTNMYMYIYIIYLYIYIHVYIYTCIYLGCIVWGFRSAESQGSI